eukprot:TRINITY_DN9285_c0_g1_i1.p1 TRINITY_DN9285_c0_g1~~TRINITY_DN9285_c0_g1_i1.p1  ORF type:complete len:839 (-),score=171.70 TRINITY_DN9285_c0_g1_i1:72-2588(-)
MKKEIKNEDLESAIEKTIGDSLKKLQNLEKRIPKSSQKLEEFELTRKLLISSLESYLTFSQRYFRSVGSLNESILKYQEAFEVAKTRLTHSNRDNQPDFEGKSRLAFFHKFIFNEANLDLSVKYSHILQQISGALKEAREIERSLSFTSIPEERFIKIWSTRFQSEAVRVIPWQLFITGLCQITPHPITDVEKRMIRQLVDPFKLGYVTPLVFLRSLVLLGPLKDFTQVAREMMESRFFVGFMDKAASEKTMMGCPPNTFLLRLSFGRVDKAFIDYINAKGDICSSPVLVDEKGVSLNKDPDSGRIYAAQNIVFLCNHLIQTYSWIPILSTNCYEVCKYPSIITESLAHKLLEAHIPNTYIVYYSPDQKTSYYNITYLKEHKITKTIMVDKNREGYYFNNQPEKFPSMQKLIDSHPNLRYPYSDTLVPTLKFTPFLNNVKNFDFSSLRQSNSTPSIEDSSNAKTDTIVDCDVSGGDEESGLYVLTRNETPDNGIVHGCIIRRVGNRICYVLGIGKSKILLNNFMKAICDSLSSIFKTVEDSQKMLTHLKTAVEEMSKDIPELEKDCKFMCSVISKIDGREEWGILSLTIGNFKTLRWAGTSGFIPLTGCTPTEKNKGVPNYSYYYTPSNLDDFIITLESSPSDLNLVTLLQNLGVSSQKSPSDLASSIASVLPGSVFSVLVLKIRDLEKLSAWTRVNVRLNAEHKEKATTLSKFSMMRRVNTPLEFKDIKPGTSIYNDFLASLADPSDPNLQLYEDILTYEDLFKEQKNFKEKAREIMIRHLGFGAKSAVISPSSFNTQHIESLFKSGCTEDMFLNLKSLLITNFSSQFIQFQRNQPQ